MLCLLQRANTLQLIGVKDMDKKKKRRTYKSFSFYINLLQFNNIFIYKLYLR